MYKIGIKDLAPKGEAKRIFQNEKCLLGVSVSNPLYQSPEKLEYLFKWLANNFDNVQIIIGDYLNRINENINFGKQGEEAVLKSLYIGELLHSQIEIELKKYPSGKFSIIHWKDFLDNNPKHKDILNTLQNHLLTNPLFRESIETTAKTFIAKNIKKGNIYLSENLALEKSIQYILEEMAVFSLFIEDGYILQVYPGTTLTILKELANNKHTDIDTNLCNGVYIDLTIKKN